MDGHHRARGRGTIGVQRPITGPDNAETKGAPASPGLPYCFRGPDLCRHEHQAEQRNYVVNWTKRAEKAAAGILYPGEHLLAGTKLTQEQFRVAGGGTTAGFVAGGVVGALAGAAWDKHREAKLAAADDSRPSIAVEELPTRQVEFPRNGAIVAVTGHRLLFFKASEFGKAKELFYETPVTDIRALHEHDVEQKLLQGAPPSRSVTIEFTDGTTLALWGITGSGNVKWLDAFTAAIRQAARIS